MDKLIDLKGLKLEPIPYSLTGAERIKNRAIEAMNEEAHDSAYFYERELIQAYWNLRHKVGEEESKRIVDKLTRLPF